MPALTYDQINDALSTYKDPEVSMKAALNQVIPRLYSMGIYRDLTIQYSLPIVDGCITLPDDAESVLFMQRDYNPAKVRSLWHDFKAAGMTGAIDPQIWGLVDAGYHPTKRLLPSPVTTIFLRPSSYDVDQTHLHHQHFSLRVQATDGERVYEATVQHDTNDGNEYVWLTFPAPVTSILSIRYVPQSGSRIIDLRFGTGSGQDNTGVIPSENTIATVGPGAVVTRYRRYRIPASSTTTTAHVLVKRAFQPIINDDDIVYISSIAAIKHGLLALVAEDNADLERSTYHWTEAQKNLELELESARGSAIPSIQFDIIGMEGRSKLQQLM